MDYKKVFIGIDQSYQTTGISVVADGKLKDIKSIDLSKKGSNIDKRRALRLYLGSLLSVVTSKSEEVICIIERIRLRSGKDSFININYIKSIGALNATIVDTCAQYGVETYSVDTRCWKAQVVGTCKREENIYSVPSEKWPTVKWILDQGLEHKILVKLPKGSLKQLHVFHKGRSPQKYMYNTDAADSAGIAMFGIIGDHEKLQLES